MNITSENFPSTASISKSNESYNICPNYQHDPISNLDAECDISLTSGVEALNQDENSSSTRKRRSSGRVSPRFNRRKSKVRKEMRRKRVNKNYKPIVYKENDTASVHKRQNASKVTTRYSSRMSTAGISKQAKRKRSNMKTKSFEYGDNNVCVQNVKHDFHQLSAPEQRKFMKEMVNEVTLRGVLPPEAGTIDKGLKIQNINKCVIQIEPLHGEYFTHGPDNM